MRVFYIFEIKKHILKEYKYNLEELFNLFNNLHYINEESTLEYKFLNIIINKIDSYFYSNIIKNINISSEKYMCINNIHTYNDYFTNENTKMIIFNSYIKIETNKNIPFFFYELVNFNNLFVCDFNNYDYFLLNETF